MQNLGLISTDKSLSMRTFSWIKRMRPALVLIYLSSMGFICILGVHRYLGIEIDLANCLTFMGVIFGIYTLNRFTDHEEDFTNDLERLLFFNKQGLFLILACSALVLSIGFLWIQNKANWMHILLLVMGMTYSFRLIPFYWKGKGFYLVRIKELTFLKNLTVSFLWGTSVFVLPILYSSPLEYNKFTVGLLATSLFLSTLNNTLFDDILDEAGDRVARIKTLPTVWGSRKSQLMLISVDIIWIGVVTGLFLASQIDVAHTTFLAFFGIYPFIYMGLNASRKLSKGWIDFISETDLLLFGLGLVTLSI